MRNKSGAAVEAACHGPSPIIFSVHRQAACVLARGPSFTVRKPGLTLIANFGARALMGLDGPASCTQPAPALACCALLPSLRQVCQVGHERGAAPPW